MAILEIKDLHVSVEQKEILRGVDFTFQSGEVHAIMGPNGNGKSTLLQTIMGHPKYEVTKGDILLDGQSIRDKAPHERSRAGLFLGMQLPPEIAGISNFDFLNACVKAHGKQGSLSRFAKSLDQKIEALQMPGSTASRYLNDGFSGGEKKRNEILQMLMLEPQLVMLDEIDSGLDIDAMKIVSDTINESYRERGFGLIVVSHYQRFYEYIAPDFVHVIINGKVQQTGDISLSRQIDREGYDRIIAQSEVTSHD